MMHICPARAGVVGRGGMPGDQNECSGVSFGTILRPPRDSGISDP